MSRSPPEVASRRQLANLSRGLIEQLARDPFSGYAFQLQRAAQWLLPSAPTTNVRLFF